MLDPNGNQIPDTYDDVNGGGGMNGRGPMGPLVPSGDWFAQNQPPITTGQNGLPRDAGAGTTPPPSAGTGAPQTFDANWFNTIFPGDTLSSEMLMAKEAELQKLGVKVLRNAEGRAGKIQLPNGQIVDVVQGGSAGLNRKQWLTGDASGGGSLGSLGSLGQGFGGLTAPFTGQFAAPNQADLEKIPGYQFARDQGLQAIDRSAASKGTLLTGGNLKDLAGFAGGIASQNYNSVFNQNLATFGTNRDSFWHNQDAPYQKLYGLASLGKPTTP